MKKLVAVIGATGQTGKHIVHKLMERNIPVRAEPKPDKGKKDVW